MGMNMATATSTATGMATATGDRPGGRDTDG